MLTVISPAKRLDETPRDLPAGLEPTEPDFAADAAKLARIAKGLSVEELRALMDISEPLARLNRDRFRAFKAKPTPDAVKPAAFCFDGDTYAGLEAKTLDTDALRWGQGHLRILSGLYGLLRPLDLIQPYRLEMGTSLKNPKGANLYKFWGPQIAQYLNERLTKDKSPVIINLASQEYFKSVDRKALQARVVECVFEDYKGGKYKVISFNAKRARGLMARWAILNKANKPEDLLAFDSEGYAFDKAASEPDRLVFRRKLES